jgi:hypothetical protein
MATPATSACEPSPLAIPSTSDLLDLSAAGSWIHEQNRAHRRTYGSARGGPTLEGRHVTPEGVAGGRAGDADQRDENQDQQQQSATDDHQHDRSGQTQRGPHPCEQPAHAGSREGVGRRTDRHGQAHDCRHQPERVPGEHDHRERDHGGDRHERHNRAQPARHGH